MLLCLPWWWCLDVRRPGDDFSSGLLALTLSTKFGTEPLLEILRACDDDDDDGGAHLGDLKLWKRFFYQISIIVISSVGTEHYCDAITPHVLSQLAIRLASTFKMSLTSEWTSFGMAKREHSTNAVHQSLQFSSSDWKFWKRFEHRSRLCEFMKVENQLQKLTSCKMGKF